MTEDSTPEGVPSIGHGDAVYTDEGDRLGVVTEFTDDGLEIVYSDETVDVEDPSSGEERLDPAVREEHPGQKFGEGYLQWRCDECGEMGQLEVGMPDQCPNCGAPKEALYRTVED